MHLNLTIKSTLVVVFTTSCSRNNFVFEMENVAAMEAGVIKEKRLWHHLTDHLPTKADWVEIEDRQIFRPTDRQAGSHYHR